jgi:hypothetical protein
MGAGGIINQYAVVKPAATDPSFTNEYNPAEACAVLAITAKGPDAITAHDIMVLTFVLHEVAKRRAITGTG